MITHTPKILIVDDQEINRIVLAEILKRQGYAVIEAENGPSARERAREELPDLILLDVMMPGEQGFDTCRLLKKDPYTADIVVIFVSAVYNVESKVEGLNAGAVDYVTKPFHATEIAARVRLHLRLAMAQKELALVQAQKLEALAAAQRSIFPDPGDLPDAGFAVVRRSFAEAGGDFYDVIELGKGRHSYMVADVSGHGLGVSLTTAALKALTSQNVTAINSPGEALKTMNSVLRRILEDGRHVTACMVEVNRNTNQAEIICAGHPPALFSAAEGFIELGQPGEPLGAFPALVVESVTTRVKRGDRLYVYTDGLIESPVTSRSDGLAELKKRLAAKSNVPLKETLESVFRELDSGTDDALLMGIEV